MRPRRDEALPVPDAVHAALSTEVRPVLAISGGLDSMVLLHAAASFDLDTLRPIVATFDHGTGPAAAHAVGHVSAAAGAAGLECVTGKARATGLSEEEWRRSRWRFLREVAASTGGRIVTAHTLDDQVETIFMRILREAGPRGLAGLYAHSEVVRPFVNVSRAQLEAYAGEQGVKFVTDPTNDSRRYLRNRVRHDLLPSIAKVRPRFARDLIDISRRSAEWRRSMDSILEAVHSSEDPDGSLRIARSSLAGFDAESLRVLWPALAARAHVVMDRRGTHRAAEFTMRGLTGRSIQLSGMFEIVMHRDHLLLRRWGNHPRSIA
ncbi:MAG: tRNA lysidine(34) synthetase TilS [Gemmatimonadaceae bacterium]|nr:tRNA lysidine(34) synthetase TilS [Gemmatimonadaceae bacterium]